MKQEVLKTLEWMKEVGGRVSFGSMENRFGEKVTIKGILYVDGQFYAYDLACISSRDLGLGTCNCVSHDPYSYLEISEEEAGELLQKYENI